MSPFKHLESFRVRQSLMNAETQLEPTNCLTKSRNNTLTKRETVYALSL